MGDPCSVKWTALATPAFIGIESSISMFILREPLPMYARALVIGVAGVLYVTLFAVHFYLLPFSGEGNSLVPRWIVSHAS